MPGAVAARGGRRSPGRQETPGRDPSLRSGPSPRAANAGSISPSRPARRIRSGRPRLSAAAGASGPAARPGPAADRGSSRSSRRASAAIIEAATISASPTVITTARPARAWRSPETRPPAWQATPRPAPGPAPIRESIRAGRAGASRRSSAAPAGMATTRYPVKRAWAVAERASSATRSRSAAPSANRRSRAARSPPACRWLTRAAAKASIRSEPKRPASEETARSVGRPSSSSCRNRLNSDAAGPVEGGRRPLPSAPRGEWPAERQSAIARAVSGTARSTARR